VTVGHADRNLEVVLLPVSDVDRSKEFCKVLSSPFNPGRV
jgi:hypothetical protein